MQILDRNWRCSEGELDIVGRDGDCLVFVEVKTRSTTAFGDPAEAVNRAKAARLRRLALCWLDATAIWFAGARPIRFDVVSVVRAGPGRPVARPPEGRAVVTLGRTLGVALLGVHGELVEVQADLCAGLPGAVVHRTGRHVGGRVPGSDPGCGAEQRHRLAEPQDHGGAAAGRRAQGRLALRPRAGRRGAGRGGGGAARCGGRRAVAGRAGPRRPAATGARRAAGRADRRAGRHHPGGRRPGERRRGRPGRSGRGPQRTRSRRGHRLAARGGRAAADRGSGDGVADEEDRRGHGPGRCPGPGHGEAGAGDRRRRRASPLPQRASRGGQDHAGPAAARPAAAARRRDSAGGDGRPLGRRASAGARAADPAGAVPGATPHGVAGGPGRRRLPPRPTGRDLAGTRRRAVPRRSGGVRPARPRRPAATARGGSRELHRGGGSVRYPARFQLVLAANPCPCGSRGRECVCAPHVRRRYQQRLSGPLLDRVDLQVPVDASRTPTCSPTPPPKPAPRWRSRVAAARDRAVRALERHTVAHQRRRSGAGVALRAVAVAVRRGRAGRDVPVPRRHQRTRSGPRTAGGLDAGRPGRASGSRSWRTSSEALFFRTGHSPAWAA